MKRYLTKSLLIFAKIAGIKLIEYKDVKTFETVIGANEDEYKTNATIRNDINQKIAKSAGLYLFATGVHKISFSKNKKILTYTITVITK